MDNIKTIILSDLTNSNIIIAYVNEHNLQEFQIKGSDKKINKKIVMREKILDFICEYIDQKLMFTQKQYGISLKKVDNTLMIIIEQMEITNSFYNAEDGFFVFPKPMIKKANFISIKYLYGSDLDIAIYHTLIDIQTKNDNQEKK